MRITFAPMEGITVYCYRNLHHELFSEGIDKYYTPFLAVHKHHAFKKRDIREVLPEDNPGMEDLIIPQIMTNKAEEILWALNELYERGFNEVNLNMGCPVSTVVSKRKGSGMLAEPAYLDELFSEVFAGNIPEGMKFSVKTRIGLTDPEEFKAVLPVLNKFPFSSVIIHPRVRTQMYKGEPDMEQFRWIYENSTNPIGYNGNIFTVEDYLRIKEEFPNLTEVMLGRGIVSNPALGREIAGGDKLSSDEIKNFVEGMEAAYKIMIGGDIQVMHKMKELWFYLGNNFVPKNGTDIEPYIHKIRVSRDISEYRNAKRALYRDCEIK